MPKAPFGLWSNSSFFKSFWKNFRTTQIIVCAAFADADVPKISSTRGARFPLATSTSTLRREGLLSRQAVFSVRGPRAWRIYCR